MSSSPADRPDPARWRALATPRRLVLAYVAVVAAAGLWALVARPILAIDHDVFFHLAHGRHLASTGEIPDSSYFSFVEPEKRGVNYYWLFQALVYGVYQAAGYHGLIAWRSLLYGLLLLVIGLYLFRGERSPPRLAWLAFLFGLYATHAVHKYVLVRPHAVSFLLIAAFVVVLETGGRWLWTLPPLAVLWVNVHGIEYPVMILIAGAYAGELMLARLRARGEPPGTAVTRRLAVLALVMAAVFATPHGARLVRLPFEATGYVAHVINEMARLDPAAFFGFALSPEGFTTQTIFNLLLAAGLASAAGALWRCELRPSHALLLAGALVLVAQAARFTHEGSLLLLPLLKSEGLVPRRLAWPRRLRFAAAVAVALALLTPFLYLRARTPGRLEEAYPLALTNLPHGVAAYLESVPAAGAVMNNPNLGAYFLWALDDRYRIFMDLEVAFLFDERDMFAVASAFYDREALRRFLERYDPPVLAPPIAARRFPELVAEHPRYRLVFFDDTGPVYLDARRYPRIAARDELRSVDPYRLAEVRFSRLEPAERAAFLAELERVLAVDPAISSAGQSAAILLNLEGRHEDARRRIARVLEREPGLARAHAIDGDALAGSGRHGEAESRYRRALALSDDDAERRAISRSLAGALAAQGRPAAAYEALADAVGRFNVEASWRDLHRLGLLADAAGRPEDAERLLRFALWKLPADEVETRREIEELLEDAGENPRGGAPG